MGLNKGSSVGAIISRPEVAFIFFSASVLSLWTGDRTLSLLTATIGIGLFLGWRSSINGTEFTLSNRSWKFLLIFIFILICIMTIIAHRTPIGVPLVFYFLLIAITVSLGILIIARPHPILILPTLLFATSIRASYWYAAPVIGRDVRLHLAFTRYIIEKGTQIPEAVSYYYFYPVGHIFASMTTKILGLPIRVSFFLSIGIAAIIGISITAFFVPQLVKGLERSYVVQMSLISALYLSVAPYHLRYSSVLIVQSLMLIFVALSFFAFTGVDKRVLSVGLIAILALTITHNAPGLVLIFFGVVMTGVCIIAQRYDIPTITRSAPAFTTAVVFLLVVEYWILVDYFDLQLARILRLLDSGGTLSEATSSTPTEGILQSPLLHTSLGLLFAGAILVAAVVIIVRKLNSNQMSLPIDYLAGVALLLASLGAVVFVGLDTNIYRLVPLVSIFIAPVVGYVLTQVSIQGNMNALFAIIMLLLLPGFIFISAAGTGYSPGTPVTETRPNSYQNYLTDSGLHGAVLATKYGEPTADKYVSDTLSLQNGYSRDSDDLNTVLVNEHSGKFPCETGVSIYLQYYESAFNVTQPSGSVVGNTGETRIISCSGDGTIE